MLKMSIYASILVIFVIFAYLFLWMHKETIGNKQMPTKLLSQQKHQQAIVKEATIDLKNSERLPFSAKIKRLLFLLGGMIALALAILGLFVPGLPTTPFALLSGALFAKSNKKMHDWLLNSKLLGPRIRNYKRKKGLTLKDKYRVIALMTTMVLISSFLIIKIVPVRIIVLTAGLIGGIVVRFFVPTAQKE